MATTAVSYSLLLAEPWWARETIPPRLEAFYAGLRAFLGRGADAVGGKGDNRHRYGYHRSREWVINSRYSVYRAGDYSVQDRRDKGGDDRWIAALDATPYNVETLIGMCRRLDAAVKAGELPQVREWYGTLNGRVVDGWDAVRQRAATSDSSHLWHLHISFFRSMADHDHSHLLAVLTGDDDMPTVDELVTGLLNQRLGRSDITVGVALQSGYTNTVTLKAEVAALRAAVEGMAAGTDAAAILAGIDEKLADFKAGLPEAVADAVIDEIAS